MFIKSEYSDKMLTEGGAQYNSFNNNVALKLVT